MVLNIYFDQQNEEMPRTLKNLKYFFVDYSVTDAKLHRLIVRQQTFK